MPKKREEDPYKDIRKEWKLTYDLKTDFPISTTKRYLRESPYVRYNQQTIIDIQRILILRVFRLLEELLNEEQIECFNEGLTDYINSDIKSETKCRRSINEIEEELEKQQKKDDQEQDDNYLLKP